MISPGFADILGTVFFLLAVVHTFNTHYFHRLAAKNTVHAGLWGLMAEVEAVFGLWALAYVMVLALIAGPRTAISFTQSLDFTQPLFVFAVMLLASSKPVLSLGAKAILSLASAMPIAPGVGAAVAALTLGPILGAYITQPAAMTVTALILYLIYFKQPLGQPLKYAMLGVLFVNMSIGGVLSPFGPPAVMAAPAWGLGPWGMLTLFGWKAILAMAFNAMLLVLIFYGQLKKVSVIIPPDLAESPPAWISATHLAFLMGLAWLADEPKAFSMVLLTFLGFTRAYAKDQGGLMLREALMVAIFLGGLVTLGQAQQWWVGLVMSRLDHLALFWCSTGLTAVVDNSALTYLGSLVPQLSDQAKYALLTGAVTGGGLTIIANAPNPVGNAILKYGFSASEIRPPRLFLAALIPTLVAAAAFLLLP